MWVNLLIPRKHVDDRDSLEFDKPFALRDRALQYFPFAFKDRDYLAFAFKDRHYLAFAFKDRHYLAFAFKDRHYFAFAFKDRHFSAFAFIDSAPFLITFKSTKFQFPLFVDSTKFDQIISTIQIISWFYTATVSRADRYNKLCKNFGQGLVVVGGGKQN